jgi:hypothetical protein
MRKTHKLFSLVLVPAAIGSVLAYSPSAQAAAFSELGDAPNVLSTPQVIGFDLTEPDPLALIGRMSRVGDMGDVFSFFYSGPTAANVDFGLSVTPESSKNKVNFAIFRGTDLVNPLLTGTDPESGTPVGLFNPGEQIVVRFSPGAALTATVTQYTATFSATAVPTPALLPALLGMGAAAWRKRKSQEEIVEA